MSRLSKTVSWACTLQVQHKAAAKKIHTNSDGGCKICYIARGMKLVTAVWVIMCLRRPNVPSGIELERLISLLLVEEVSVIVAGDEVEMTVVVSSTAEV